MKKDDLLSLLGTMPTKTDLDLKVIEEVDCGAFIRKTLAPDAICFEERADETAPILYHAHQLHTRLMQGRTLLGKVLFDISVGIDLLQSLPEVDSTRIGFIGHSYGGRTALFAPAIDKRIKVSVSNCGSTTFKEMLAQKIGIQFDYVLPNFLTYGDIENVVRLV